MAKKSMVGAAVLAGLAATGTAAVLLLQSPAGQPIQICSFAKPGSALVSDTVCATLTLRDTTTVVVPPPAPPPPPPAPPPPPPPPAPPPAGVGFRVEYGTYLGGTGDDEAREPVLLSGGRLLVGLRTESSDAVTTTGAFQRTFGGTSDSYLAIVSADGKRLEAATFFGGSGFERPPYGYGITASGDIIFTSGTSSPNLPTTATSFRRTITSPLPEPGDGYACRISGDLTTMRWCTYLGGGWPRGGLALDAQDNPIIVGDTKVASYPTTTGVVQPSPRGVNDAFVLKLAGDGTRALWSTRLGSGGLTGTEVATGVVVLLSGALSIVGSSYGGDFAAPGTVRAYGGASDLFVSTLSATGTTATTWMLGGTGNEGASHRQAVLADGIVVGVMTSSPTLPGVAGTLRGSADAVVLKVNAGSTGLAWATAIRGSGTETILGPVAGPGGRIYVVGGTSSTDLPVTPNALQPVYGGGTQDGFVAVLSPLGVVEYLSYLGGPGADLLRAVEVTPAGELYIVGLTDSSPFPVTAGAFRTVRTKQDGFVVKLAPIVPPPPPGGALLMQTLWAEPRAERDTLINGQTVPFFGARDSVERCVFVQFADSAVGRFNQGIASSANCSARLAVHVARWRKLSAAQQAIVDTSYVFARFEPSGPALVLVTRLGTLPAMPTVGWRPMPVLYTVAPYDTLPWPRVRTHGTNGGGWRHTVLGYARP